MRQKHLVCFLGSQFQLLLTQNATLSFTRSCSDIIQFSWKTFKLLYRKFIQDNVYQIYQNRLSFVEDMTKTFWCVFRFTV